MWDFSIFICSVVVVLFLVAEPPAHIIFFFTTFLQYLGVETQSFFPAFQLPAFWFRNAHKTLGFIDLISEQQKNVRIRTHENNTYKYRVTEWTTTCSSTRKERSRSCGSCGFRDAGVSRTSHNGLHGTITFRYWHISVLILELSLSYLWVLCWCWDESIRNFLRLEYWWV